MSDINRRFFDALMAEKKLSLRALAGQMGMNHSQLSLTFSGGRKLQLDEAAQLSQIFGVPLHKIVEAAGVTVRPYGSRRVPVVGAVRGDGSVDLYERGVIERTTAPEDMPDDTIGVQVRAPGTPLEWLDGAVMFCRQPQGVDHAFLGRLCLLKIRSGPAAVAMVKRGYTEGTFNLSAPYRTENATLEWASPITLTRN